jgi:hypothetical protein
MRAEGVASWLNATPPERTGEDGRMRHATADLRAGISAFAKTASAVRSGRDMQMQQREVWRRLNAIRSMLPRFLRRR